MDRTNIMNQSLRTAVLVALLSSGITTAIILIAIRYLPLDTKRIGFGLTEPTPGIKIDQSSTNSRYMIVFSPHVERDIFLLDTATGRTWEYVTLTDVQGRPQVWMHSERLDDEGAERAFVARTGMKQPLVGDLPKPSGLTKDEDEMWEIMTPEEQQAIIRRLKSPSTETAGPHEVRGNPFAPPPTPGH